MELTWVMAYKSFVAAVEPPLSQICFATSGTLVGVPPVASCKLKYCTIDPLQYNAHADVVSFLIACKLKHSLYHLIYSSTICMQMLYPIRLS